MWKWFYYSPNTLKEMYEREVKIQAKKGIVRPRSPAILTPLLFSLLPACPRLASLSLALPAPFVDINPTSLSISQALSRLPQPHIVTSFCLVENHVPTVKQWTASFTPHQSMVQETCPRNRIL